MSCSSENLNTTKHELLISEGAHTINSPRPLNPSICEIASNDES